MFIERTADDSTAAPQRRFHPHVKMSPTDDGNRRRFSIEAFPVNSFFSQ